MEEKDDIFKFEDFLGGNKMEDLKKMKSNLLKEGLFSDNESVEDEEINQDFNPYKNSISNKPLEIEDDVNYEDDVDTEDKFYDDDENDSYVLYKDKSEDFICDIAIEGVNQNDTEVRLIIESDDWNLMFIGEVNNGKCIIPIKKLSIFNEGQRGNIKLEVNADGSLFTPWEDEFVIKTSKKVTVSLNENKKSSKETGVKVKVNKKRP
jgi:hypothetical protein